MKNYIQYELTGKCKIDVASVIKKFTLLNRIFCYHDKYFLMGFTPKCKQRLKVRIRKEDAETIIKELQLKPIRDDFFVQAVTYVPVA